MFPPATNGAHRSTQNGYVNGSASDTHVHMNGDVDGVDEDVPIERLEGELPVVEDGLVPLAEVVSRIVQACYAELSDLAETLPPPPLGGDALTDEARKQEMVRKQALARFCQRWKKQITKLYAVAKWSRDAHIIQKCMNITAFLLSQNEQFVDVIHALTRTKEELSGARVRNHDLLTSLDVLTTGTYQRLPADIRKRVFAPKPLDDTQIARTLERIEAAIRFRLRVHEIVPVEMSSYRVDDGRAFFTVPGLFEVSICLLGMDRTDSWFFTSVEFLFDVGGELVRDEELPKKPTGHVLQWISDECDTRLGFYSTEQPPAPVPLLPSQEPPQPRKPRLEDGVVDAPLVRLFNFLQMMSMSYQLEILWQQAERLRYLGWGEYLSVRMSEDRHTLTLTYWLRPPPPAHPTTRAPAKIPLYGGTLSIGLVSSTVPRRTPRARVLAELQSRARLAGRGPGTGAGESPGRDAVGGGSLGRPSDEVESLRWEVRWEPQIGAIGSRLLPEDAVLHGDELQVDPANLDVEKLLRTAIQKHVRGFFRVFLNQMQNGAFALRDAVSLVTQPDGSMALRTMLCADETVFTALDARTGRIKLWDTGDLGAAGRGSRFTALTERVNENPGGLLIRVLVQLRLNTIIDLAQQKAHYLGYQTYKMGNFHDHTNFGRFARAQLYIQLAPYPSHYLVLVVTDDDFRYALISASPDPKSMYGQLVMNDIGWLDVSRICTRPVDEESTGLGKRRRDEEVAADSKFKLETNVLRELYAYCCARVAHMNVEKQFKQHSIPYKHVFPASSLSPSSLPTSVSQIHSALSSNIPSLCVQSADIIKEDKALDAAMPNIRVIPLAWWAASKSDQAEERPPQVVTCVKLRYVQQPVGRRAGAGRGTGIIRPSKSIVYDANEAIVCFLADEVEGCVELFMKEWNSVSKIVAIAREVAQMAKRWDDVRLLSFDLQTVEFAYSSDFVLSVTCDDPTDPSAGSFHLYFSRLAPTTPPPSSDAATTSFPDAPGPVSSSAVSALLPLKRPYNPHSDAEPFFLHILRTNPLSCLPHLVDVLRNTVPIVAVLEDIRAHAERSANFNSNSASLSEAVATATQSTPADWSWADIDAYPKSASWWRVTFGPGARHALDFRLLHTPGLTSGDRALPRVTILDASYVLNSATSYSSPTLEAGLLFKPIPGMREIVRRAVKNAKKRTRVASVDVGAVCEISDVESVGRELWKCVLAEFKVMDSGGTS